MSTTSSPTETSTPATATSASATTPSSTPPLTVVLTGASDGIGAAAAGQLSAQGHRVLIVGRSPHKTDAVARATGAEAFVADFARLDEVRRLAGELAEAAGPGGIDVLANNAGGIFGDRTPTPDGLELTIQVNHLAPFLLTNLLLPSLRTGGGASVITTSSMANRVAGPLRLDLLDRPRRAAPMTPYSEAKLANILMTRRLHQRFHSEGISAVAFHPGLVRSNFASRSSSLMRLLYGSPLAPLVTITSEQSGEVLSWLITGTPGRTWTSGRYYELRRPSARVSPQADDLDLAEALWQRSAQLVGLAGSD